jgi:hypothetical protein
VLGFLYVDDDPTTAPSTQAEHRLPANWKAHPRLASYAIQTFELWNEPQPGRHLATVAPCLPAARGRSVRSAFTVEWQSRQCGRQPVLGAWVSNLGFRIFRPEDDGRTLK